jgi:multiple sugar transport system substrate-binding protein
MRGEGSRHRRRLAVASLLTAAAVAGCGGGAGKSGPVTLNWYVFKDKSGAFDDVSKTCSKESRGAYEIKINLLPADADGQREQLVRRLAAKDDSIDLMGMDVIWTAEFAEAGWIRAFPPRYRTQVSRDMVPAALQTATYKNKLFGAPLNSNAQILFYRKDLAKQPPKTWNEMIAVASKLPAAKNKIEVQAAQYEGYTVWFNSLVNSAGGTILGSNGKAALGAPAVRALTVMHDLATSPAADPSMSNQKEDETFANFSSGKAAFMVNYPAFYAQLNKENKKLAKDVGIARWPAVDANRPSRTTIGGINLGIAAFSKHPQEAFQAATCMNAPAQQKVLVVKGSFAPANLPLYDNPETIKVQPFAPLLKQAVLDASIRPQTPAYNDVSLAIQKTLSPPADIDPKRSEQELKDKIDKALKSGGLL